jgi:abhydrolase domain-containing protein 12
MHNLRVQPFVRYDTPKKYDLARKCPLIAIDCTLSSPNLIPRFPIPRRHPTAFKTRNVYLHTADETLGAWFSFADPFHAAHKADLRQSPSGSGASSSSSSPDELLRSALRAHPTVLFLHGNGNTRSLPPRVRHYQAFAARLRANVLAPDYRSFGDSTGTPSEVGLTLDARAAWDWLRESGAPPESVLVVGNSLGTGVAVQFVSALEAERGEEEDEEGAGAVLERPRGVVLLAPFTNVEKLLDTYYIAGIVPLLAPLRTFPFVSSESKSFFFSLPLGGE